MSHCSNLIDRLTRQTRQLLDQYVAIQRRRRQRRRTGAQAIFAEPMPLKNRLPGKARSTLQVPVLVAVVLMSFCNIAAASEPAGLIEVFVALADNRHQGIVPVPNNIGNGDDPGHNLYWGAMYGLKTMLNRDNAWKPTGCEKPKTGPILQTCRYRRGGLTLAAHAYRGREIKKAVYCFLDAAAGRGDGPKPILVVYIGHNGLMEFGPPPLPKAATPGAPRVIILACAAKAYFGQWLKAAGAKPLLWTTGLMAPEAYTLLAALDGWAKGETDQSVRLRAARAYAKYQNIKTGAAKRLLVSGW